jgi:hypothetical protein
MEQNGKYNVLGRNEDTAYLTKFLRSYGGAGEHEDYKIGRVLRNITFTGKGFVNRPANEDSVIFSKNIIIPVNTVTSNDNIEEKNEEIVNSGVLNFQSNIQSETLIMSSANTEVEMETTQVPTVAEVAVETVTEEVQVAEVNAAELTSKIEELTVANEALQAEIEQIKSEAAKKTEEQMKKEEEMMKKSKSELEAALTTIAEYVAKEEAMMKKEKKMKRMATLIEAGIDNESAEATVDKFESLDDEAFEAMTSLFAGKLPPWLEKFKKKDKEEEAMMMRKRASEETSIEADPSVLETAEVEANVNLGVGSSDVESALESTRAALVEFVSSKLGKKN